MKFRSLHPSDKKAQTDVLNLLSVGTRSFYKRVEMQKKVKNFMNCISKPFFNIPLTQVHIGFQGVIILVA